MSRTQTPTVKKTFERQTPKKTYRVQASGRSRAQSCVTSDTCRQISSDGGDDDDDAMARNIDWRTRHATDLYVTNAVNVNTIATESPHRAISEPAEGGGVAAVPVFVAGGRVVAGTHSHTEAVVAGAAAAATEVSGENPRAMRSCCCCCCCCAACGDGLRTRAAIVADSPHPSVVSPEPIYHRGAQLLRREAG